MKIDNQNEDSNKSRKDDKSKLSFPVVGRHCDYDRNSHNNCSDNDASYTELMNMYFKRQEYLQFQKKQQTCIIGKHKWIMK